MVHASIEAPCCLRCRKRRSRKINAKGYGIKGDTATNTLKPATVETGAGGACALCRELAAKRVSTHTAGFISLNM